VVTIEADDFRRRLLDRLAELRRQQVDANNALALDGAINEQLAAWPKPSEETIAEVRRYLYG
jgi:hypothetical protein